MATNIYRSIFAMALLTSTSLGRISGTGPRRRLEAYNPDEDLNYLQILVDRYPECALNKLSAHECEQFIKNIHDIEGTEAPDLSGLKSVILYKRTEEDPTYNAVVIQTSENDMVLGRNDDGMIYYDFPWKGSGEAATEEAIKSTYSNIGPSKYTKNVVTTSDYGIEADLSCGGDYNPFAISKPAGKARLDAILSQPVAVPPAGPRTIGPFNCQDMSGKDCCKMIKHLVPDMDTKGNVIQGWLSYKKGHDDKVVEFKNENKVKIISDGDGQVGVIPELKRGYKERLFFE